MSSSCSCSKYIDNGVRIDNTDVSTVYSEWDSPVTIISDGAYGTGLFPGEPDDPSDLQVWYEPHVEAWSERATPQTTLWFWNTERGWAEVHPLLEEHGWTYRGTNIWDKGVGHIAGNSNTQTLRKFPQVTEVCVQYVREPEFEVGGESVGMQEWLVSEWERTGLTFSEANTACGVSDAASRKYLTRDAAWYYPPPDRMAAMVAYANEHGASEGRPYFAPDGEHPITAEDWKTYRAKFDCPAGVTNVWKHPQVSGDERLSGEEGAFHINQKPLELVQRIIQASTDVGDVVWAPFGGLCTSAVASKQLGRPVFVAEVVDDYFDAGVSRVANTDRETKSITTD